MNMKNLILVLTIFIGTLSTANAQFGIKGGIVRSNLNTDAEDVSNDEGRDGYTFGVLYNYCLGCDFGLQTELNYVQKGEKYDVLLTEVDARMDYIDLPISVTWQPIGPLYIYGGPLFSFKLAEDITYKVGGSEISFEDDKNFKGFDFGYNAGVGAKLGNIFIDFRLTKSWIDADEKISNGDITIDKNDLRHRTLQLTAGYLFD